MTPDHQLHQRHDIASQGRDDHASQCVPECGRHARAPRRAASATVDAADVSRQRLDVRVDRDCRRRHPCLPAQGGCARSSPCWAPTDHDASAAPTVLIGVANGPQELRAPRRGVRVLTAARRRPRPRSTASRVSSDGSRSLRSHRDRAVHPSASRARSTPLWLPSARW